MALRVIQEYIARAIKILHESVGRVQYFYSECNIFLYHPKISHSILLLLFVSGFLLNMVKNNFIYPANEYSSQDRTIFFKYCPHPSTSHTILKYTVLLYGKKA